MVGIIGYGAYIPKYRIKAEEIAAIWGQDPRRIIEGLRIQEKSVPGLDEDSATMAIEASRNALMRAGIDPTEIGAVYSGSESKVYAVKPNATMVGDALGVGHKYMAADVEFACKAGTATMQMLIAEVEAGMIDCGLAIGIDTAQGRPGDALEYSAAAGGAAFLIGRDEKKIVAKLEHTCSSSSDTPDFWRRQKEEFPVHRERFSGKPSYETQIALSVGMLLEKLDLKAADFDRAVFHTPNGKFPLAIGKKLGFTMKQMEAGYIVPVVGNTYSGASLLGFASTLDTAGSGERILVASYGSGAGSDAFSWVTTPQLKKRRELAPSVRDYIDHKQYLSYGQYIRHTGILG